MKLKHNVTEVLKITAVSTMGDCVQAISDRVEDYLTTNNVLAVVPGGDRKAGSGETMVTSMLTAPEPKAFREEVRQWVWWEEVRTRTRW